MSRKPEYEDIIKVKARHSKRLSLNKKKSSDTNDWLVDDEELGLTRLEGKLDKVYTVSLPLQRQSCMWYMHGACMDQMCAEVN